ncbi:hypothetical protein PENSUB_7752 [Penicillium subrubescens]|jgi:hypothetical protein|uniref:Uncharacterized protein n=1 Tax=Penicillium subrubescens TaxID=1316194 RepID=A0A1Q5TK55_9EURO|nr:hypothetical protein PENSUB_7752 [Penicillium subrubescens]
MTQELMKPDGNRMKRVAEDEDTGESSRAVCLPLRDVTNTLGIEKGTEINKSDEKKRQRTMDVAGSGDDDHGVGKRSKTVVDGTSSVE